MRNLTLLLTAVLVGCTGTETPSDSTSLTGFQTAEYKSLSGLNMGPRDTAEYLFNEVCTQDTLSAIAPTTSDGIIQSQGNLSLYRYYQTYQSAPVWSTKIELVYNSVTHVVENAALLVVDPIRLKNISACTIPQEEALQRIELLFLDADEALTYDMTEPVTVYYHNKDSNRWHLGWGSTIVSRHTGIDQRTRNEVALTLTYSIIIDGITGEKLLLEFNMSR